MSTDFGQWDRLASELRACREAQQETWGDLDNGLLGRYLAGDVTLQERRLIEKELQRRPELRKLTDLVSDVLRDCEPASPVLPFSAAPSTPKTTAGRWRRWAAVAAAACLLLALGYTVLPKGTAPSPPFQSSPPNVAPGHLTITNTAGFHPAFSSNNSAVDAKFPVLAARDERPMEKKSGPIDHIAVVLADGCEEAAQAYHKTGDLDMAEFSYKLAYNIRDWKFGSKAPPTIETRRNLGDVYQTALNLDEGPVATQVVATPPAQAVADKAKSRQIELSARQLRARLAKQPIHEVRKSVAPILVEGLNDAKTPEERELLARALAELGAAAKDAVPALDACLQKQDLTLREREVVQEAKVRLEKAALPAEAPEQPATAPPP
ncbi:MAG TPA: hypothetical protein VMS17_05810 [Gemmataceae bacterium]|nr:hypothetical protein [Gemmataceae bacterium]